MKTILLDFDETIAYSRSSIVKTKEKMKMNINVKQLNSCILYSLF